MNITHDNATEKVQQLSIEVNKADYTEKVETALKKYRRTAQIPGFRVGNAPMGLIKRNYEKPLIVEEVNKITSEALNDYFKKNNLQIMFEPVFLEEQSSVDFEKKEDFVFTFEFAVQPEFEIDFATLPLLKAFRIEATPTEVEEYMTQIRKRNGDYINPETIEKDDYVTVKWGEDETGFFFIKDLTEEGQQWFLGKKVEDHILVVLKEMFVSQENLKKFLKKSDDNFDETIIGDEDVKIISIGRVDLAEMNDEFFYKVFPDGSITSVESFEEYAAQQVELQWKQETDKKFINDAITLLLQNVAMELPEDFIKRFILKNHENITEEKLNQEWNQYCESFKLQLIESKLGKEAHIEVTLDDVKNYLKNYYYQNYFMQFNLADVEERLDQMVEKAVKDQEYVKQLYNQIFEQKIMELLQYKMNIEEITGNYSQFFSFISDQKSEFVSEEPKPKKTRRSPAKKKTEDNTTLTLDF